MSVPFRPPCMVHPLARVQALGDVCPTGSSAGTIPVQSVWDWSQEDTSGSVPAGTTTFSQLGRCAALSRVAGLTGRRRLQVQMLVASGHVRRAVGVEIRADL